MPQSLSEQFYELFDGNRSAVGTESGGCLRLHDLDYDWVNHVNMHLTLGGDEAVGVYPLVYNILCHERWRVKWGCVDFDEGEEASWAYALRLQKLLAKAGITAWIERSRSKGYHVWVFAVDWVPAATMRRALLVACQLVKVPTKEINPKSEGFDDPKTLGNYVRLPYPGWLGLLAGDQRRVVVDEDGRSFSPKNFARWALESRCTQSQLEFLASRYQPPKPKVVHREVNDIEAEELDDAVRRVGIRTIHILNDGPNEHRDRSSTLFWLGQMLVRDGNHTYDEVVALLKYADQRWGKFHLRHDFDQRIIDIVDKVWEDQ
jgi:hypothetical protein